MNLSPRIAGKVGKGLHNRRGHPICILKNLIYRNFKSFHKFDSIDPVVSVSDNFDKLLIPDDHPSRRPTDTYYIDENHVLRTHTSAHQNALLASGYTNFLATGDVYRKGAIDRHHYPVFHQMEGVCLCQDPLLYLSLTLETLIRDLFPGCEYRRRDSRFPFTAPSYECEVRWGGRWVEILGCGVIREEIINNCGLDGETGWAFGLGLDRLAMILFEIPDIRMLWSEDARFLGQFREGEVTKFEVFASQPSCYRDVSFWLSGSFSFNDFCELARDLGGDLVESIDRIGVPKEAESHCYRINYRGVDRMLTNGEVDSIQERICQALAVDLGVELR